MNGDIGNLHFILALTLGDDYWNLHNKETSRLDRDKNNAKIGRQNAGFKVWLKKLLTRNKISHCAENAICTECEVLCENILLVLSTPVKYHAPGVKLPKSHQLLLEYDDGSYMSCTIQMWARWPVSRKMKMVSLKIMP